MGFCNRDVDVLPENPEKADVPDGLRHELRGFI
jgi:hypothetical protein